MLMRISLIIAIIAGLAVGGVNLFLVKDKITKLIEQRDTEKKDKEQAQSDLAKTRSELDRTKKDLNQTKQDLTNAKAERDKAVANAEAQVKKAADLTEKLNTVTQERNLAQANLEAFKGTGRTPEQILNIDKEIKQTQEALEASIGEKKILDRTITRLKDRLARYEPPENYVITAPASLRGRIVAYDPKWEFVLLDFGDDQGVRENCEFLVNRNGKLVGKVIVRSVLKSRSVANVLPGDWKVGEVIEGDEVIPAHPSS